MEWGPVFSAFWAQNIFARTIFYDCINMHMVSDFSGVIRNMLHKDCIFGVFLDSSHPFKTKPISVPIT